MAGSLSVFLSSDNKDLLELLNKLKYGDLLFEIYY